VNLNQEIFELSEVEIMAIAGGSQINPPAAQVALETEVPQIDNNPPG